MSNMYDYAPRMRRKTYLRGSPFATLDYIQSTNNFLRSGGHYDFDEETGTAVLNAEAAEDPVCLGMSILDRITNTIFQLMLYKNSAK